MEKNDRKSDRSSRHSPDNSKLKQPPGDRISSPQGIPTFLRFTGVAFEMLATIGVGILSGYYTDKFFSLRFPVFLLLFSFLSLIGSLYLLYKRLPKE